MPSARVPRSCLFRNCRRRGDEAVPIVARSRSALAVRAREGGAEGGEGGIELSRRRALSSLSLAAPLLLLSRPSRASTVPALDGVWYSLTGAPPDLYFPASAFEGEFEAVSSLVSAEAPLGEDALPPESLAGLERARREDLNRPVSYRTRFIRAPAGNPATPRDAVVFDRAFNTLSLLAGTSPAAARGAYVEWDASDPNLLTLRFREEGGGDGVTAATAGRRGSVRIRVTKRSEEVVGGDRLNTSEYVQTIFNDSGDGVPRVKASQVFSKWRWREETPELRATGAPSVVATQVVSEFLGGPEAGNERAFLAASGKPIAVYTYRLALTRASAV